MRLLVIIAVFAASWGLVVLAFRGCERQAGGNPALVQKKVLVLGCDGLDHRLVSKLLDEGRLPNMARLRDQGGFRPLTTSIPPQSPVAWSNFISGADPGTHGIFDFIHRDPAQQATPYFSVNRVTTVKEREPWKIGSYQVPRDTIRNDLLRRGTPFWAYLDQAGVPVHMYRLPANYPPSKSSCGCVCCLAGMGVPDAFGSQGTYQHFSSRRRTDRESGGGLRFGVAFDEAQGMYTATLRGPKNEMVSGTPDMTKPIRIYPDPEKPIAKIVYVNEAVVGDETVTLILNEGEWSDWQPINFLKTPAGPVFHTMARFLLQRVHPDLRLYVSPLNFVPTKAETVFSEPENFVKQIGEAIGLFYTQGFAEDYEARKQRVFTDEDYRVQAGYVLDESMRMLDYALDRFEHGVLFFYFSSSDLQAHMFWWDSDDPHPVRTPEEAQRYNAVVIEVYEKLDAALGRCVERLGDDTTVIVLSDHGFCNFRRAFALNTWLRDEGYLVAREGVLVDADWSRSRAYGLGLNGLYLNLAGRERLGIVPPAQRNALLDEIAAKLLAVRDPENGARVVRRVYRTDEWYHGPEAANAPDLIVGYERDYRASWNTCLGNFDDDILVDNRSAWSADHCIAHDVVPGVLFCNRPIYSAEPALIDIAPAVLSEFGVATPATMHGRSFLQPPPVAAR